MLAERLWSDGRAGPDADQQGSHSSGESDHLASPSHNAAYPSITSSHT